MKVIERKINELIPAEYNPRQLSNEQAEQLKASLQRFGAVDPAIINTHPDRKNIIVGGHQRLKTAQSLGWDTFPCVEVELDRDKERELNIRLNKNTGAWDYDALANYFEVEELTDWGFSNEELFGDIEAEEVEAKEDDYEEPDDIKVDVVLGDLIEIGPHRLLCGDSTDSDQVAKLMNGEKADMVFTDPPFPNNSEIMHDMINNIEGAFNNSRIYCNGLMIWFWDNLQFPPFAEMVTSKHIWHKTNGWQAGHFETMYCYHNDKTRHEQIVYSVNNVGGENNRAEQGYHPTPKPISLIVDILKDKKCNTTIDLFLGSGSTMVASHQLKRKCYGMELDPKYCQVIIDRMVKLDDTLEVKINGEPYGV